MLDQLAFPGGEGEFTLSRLGRVILFDIAAARLGGVEFGFELRLALGPSLTARLLFLLQGALAGVEVAG